MVYGFKRKYYNNITECLKLQGWLEMRNYSAYRKLCLTYTAIYTKQPLYLHAIIKLKENTLRLSSSNSLLLSNQICNLDTYGKNFLYEYVFYEYLPLRICKQFKTFKKAIKIIYYAQHDILN